MTGATDHDGATGPTRREVLRRGGQLAGVTLGAGLAGPALEGALAPASADALDLPAAAGTAGRVEIREGTNCSAAVSPDGRWIALDVVGVIWVMPAAGGAARRLTGDLQDATRPSWSPDGRRIAFQSYRDGNYHLWLVDADGGGLRQLTRGRFDHREPAFAPDGGRLAFAADRDGSYGIWLFDLADGTVRQVTATPNEEGAPAWSPDGTRIAFTVDDTAVDVQEVASGTRTRAVTAPAGARVYGPAFTRDGRSLSYVQVAGAASDLMLARPASPATALTSGEDVFGFAASWVAPDEVVYTADGRVRRRVLIGGSPGGPVGGAVRDIPFAATVPLVRGRYRRRVRDITSTRPNPVRGIAGPVISRDGTQVAFRALNALWVAPLAGGPPGRVVSDGFFNSDPDFAPDGRSLVYTSDRAGTADLWLHDLDTGDDRRLTALPGAQLTPRWSPDGSRIAYTDHDGAVWVLQVATGAVQQVTPTLFLPGRPSWSPAGDVLALAAVKPYSARFREGTSQILTVDLAAGTLTYTEPMPFRSLSTRGDDGPLWSPDGGHLAFVMESVAWVVRVDGAGRFLGTPRRVTDEVTDSLAWRGPDTLGYLSNGRLRLRALTGGPARTVRIPLTWRRPRRTGRLLIRAGAVWDGESPRLRREVDIVVEGGRIAEVSPRRSRPTAGMRVVDAAGLTVMPGLIDAHNHWHLRGRQWGDRQGRLWLAYGVTTTRSPGDPVYQMLETREALESGARVGPRFFGTGEAIDGSRVYYNFMRPTLSRRQLALELDRAFALDYDMIKTYVRLPVDLQAAAARAAHRAGVPLSSHYLYPAVNLGMDGMEHTGATNRLGYSQTVSRLGRAYQDAIVLFTRSGMSITPTLFNSGVLYADDRSLVEDERTRILFPDWEYARFVQKADDARRPEAGATRELLAANVEMVLRIHRGGGLVIAGTDAPLDNIAVSLHQNLRAMVAFGFTPYEALVTAVRNPARWLGLDRSLGAVAPGMLADLAFVAGDPLADIRAAAAVRLVAVDGVLHTVDDLTAPFRSPAPRAAAPANRLERPLASARSERGQWWHEPEWATNACCEM